METTAEEITPAETTSEVSITYPKLDESSLHPVMPDDDAAAMSDAALVAEITAAAQTHEKLQNMLNGYYVETGDIILDEYNTDDGAYRAVAEDIPDEAALLRLYTDFYTESYLGSLETPVKELLFGNAYTIRLDDETTADIPWYKTIDGKLAVYSTYYGVPYSYEFDKLVITYADDNRITAVMSGTCLDSYTLDILELSFVRQNGQLMLDSKKRFNGNIYGSEFEKLINADNLRALDKIAGNVEYIMDDGEKSFEIINNIEVCEIVPFMTIAEMNEFLRTIFTEELVQSAAAQYLSAFHEQDGRLYIENVINMTSFGSFVLWRAQPRNFTFGSDGQCTINSFIPWDNGSGDVADVLVTLVNTPDGLRMGELCRRCLQGLHSERLNVFVQKQWIL